MTRRLKAGLRLISGLIPEQNVRDFPAILVSLTPLGGQGGQDMSLDTLTFETFDQVGWLARLGP
jgi:hypothetical protein